MYPGSVWKSLARVVREFLHIFAQICATLASLGFFRRSAAVAQSTHAFVHILALSARAKRNFDRPSLRNSARSQATPRLTVSRRAIDGVRAEGQLEGGSSEGRGPKGGGRQNDVARIDLAKLRFGRESVPLALFDEAERDILWSQVDPAPDLRPIPSSVGPSLFTFPKMWLDTASHRDSSLAGIGAVGA